MKLPFSDEEYKKKKESHEILVPGDLCYHANYFNTDSMGFMVVIEGNYADLYLQMPYSPPVENRHLNQYSGFTYHDNFRNPELRSLIESGAWYDRDKLVFIRHLNKLEYGTVLKLVKTRGDVPKDFVDAIFTPTDEYRDMYNKQSKNLQKIQLTTIKRPKKIKLKKIESKVKKEEPEEPKSTIRPLYGPGDLVHLKDDDKNDLYIVLGSEAYRCSSVGFVYPNIRYPSFHTYFVMNTNTHICSYTVYSNMVLYEHHFSQIALKEYYNRFLEEKI